MKERAARTEFFWVRALIVLGLLLVFTAPVVARPPLSVDLRASSDSGTYDDDNLTAVAEAVVDIVAADSGGAIRVFRNGELLGEATHVSGTLYQYTFSAGQLAEGGNSITSRHFDGIEESADSPVLEILLDLSGPRILSYSPGVLVKHRPEPWESINLTFSEPLAPVNGSGDGFFADDVTIDGPDGPIPVNAVSEIGESQYKISFDPEIPLGDYSVSIGPAIADLAGNLMDEDGDGIDGEPGEDLFTFNVEAVDVDTIIDQDITIGDGDTTYDNQVVFIDGATVTMDGAHTFAALYLSEGAVLTHTAGVAGFDLTVTGNLIVDAGGAITADGKGHPGGAGAAAPGQGPGGGSSYCPGYPCGFLGAGGGYGGDGGYGGHGPVNNPGGPSYGSLTSPADLGSGGGGANGAAGGAGGGALRITVGGTLTVEGSVSANGSDGSSSGGGAGGSINVTANTLAGSGMIRANGGSGSGGGSGGRIAIAYQGSAFLGSIEAQGGNGTETGGAGTIYAKSSTQTYGSLLLDNGGGSGAASPLVDPTYTFDTVDVINGAELKVPTGTVLSLATSTLSLHDAGHSTVFGTVEQLGGSPFAQIDVATGATLVLGAGSVLAADTVQVADGTWTIDDFSTLDVQQVDLMGGSFELNRAVTFPGLHVATGATLTHTPGVLGFDLTVTGDLTVDAGGSISADGKGHPGGAGAGAAGQGPGGGSSYCPGYPCGYLGAGGGYGGDGGYGGHGPVNNPGGYSYCSSTSPVSLGSGGGGANGAAGGAGGGALRITVGGTLTVEGSVSANGSDGSSSGGGAGGSILLAAASLQGTGIVSANGGSASGGGGGGGGGRVLLYLDYDSFGGMARVVGGAGVGAGESGAVTDLSARQLTLNKPTLDNVATDCEVDAWRFSAISGQQVRLANVASELPGIAFDFWGPNGWRGFDGLTTESSLFNLTESGAYTVVARNTDIGTSSTYRFQVSETSVTDVAPNSVVDGALAGSGQAQLFRVAISDATAARLNFHDLGIGNMVEVYAKLGSAPTRGDYDFRSSTPNSGDQSVLIPAAAPCDWYILVFAETVADPSTFTLEMETGDIFLHKVSPGRHGTAMDAVLTLQGLGFDPSTEVVLDNGVGGTYSPDSIDILGPERLEATFLANTVPVGTYSVVVSEAGGSDQLADAFEMTPFLGANVETNLVLPERLGYHQLATIWVEYTNSGDVATPAPLLVLRADQNGREAAIMQLADRPLARGFWTSALPVGFSNRVQFLASGETPGLLQPGESIRVPIQWAGWQQPWFQASTFDFQLGVLDADNTTPVDWASEKTNLRPAYVPTEAWDVIWTNFLSQVGTTWGDYVTALGDNASYLARLDVTETDLSVLLGFELDQANSAGPLGTLASATDATVPAPGLDIQLTRQFEDSIRGRYQMGALGRGWSHSWEQRIAVEDDGTVAIEGPGTARRIFQPDSRPGGGYFPLEGDHSALTELGGGAFRLVEADGSARAFRTDGLLDYIEDTNGNRITATYVDGQLTTLTHSGGQSLSLTYTPAGLLETVSDPDGRTTTYTYDSVNEHLLSAAYFDGTSTQYDYSLGVSAQKEHALTGITFPGNRHQYFTYDTQGRLQTNSRDGGAELTTFGYGSSGLITVQNAASKTWLYYRDQYGQLLKVVDPNGNETRSSFDDEFNLVSRTDPAGLSYRYEYDSRGSLTEITDPLGHSTGFSYGTPFNRMTRLTDANGNETTYTYDALGNLDGIIYPPGRGPESWSHDTDGNPISWTNGREDTLTYEYDANGRLTAKVYPDLSRVEYRYVDGRGNLTSFADSTGTTTLTYYYPEDRLKRITDPDGRWLEYTYNTAGQRASMLNQLGHRLDYSYDVVRRLESISDETSTEIVHYRYDAVGRLERKDLQNGVYTLYGYDDASQLTSLVNYKPDDSILSQFLYTYDERGRRTTIMTLEGQWTYGYDATGQLTSWTAPDGRSVQYEYDGMGNRVRVIDDGVTTQYATNNLNQYTQVGTTTLEYDLDGNLVENDDGTNVRTFAYDEDNRLTAVADTLPAKVEGYVYNAVGHRVRHSKNGMVTDYVIDPLGLGDLVGEYDGTTASLIATYEYGAGLLGRSGAGGARTLGSFDASGNTREATNFASGTTENSYDYDPFGNSISGSETTPNPFKFVGEFGAIADPSSLLYMRNRFFDPASGRFLNPDPIGLSGNDTNLYRYVGNDPVGFVDPAGLEKVRPWWQYLPETILCEILHFTCDAAKVALEHPLEVKNGIEGLRNQGKGGSVNFELNCILNGGGAECQQGDDNGDEGHTPCTGSGKFACDPDDSPAPECSDLDECSDQKTDSAGSGDPNEKTGSGGYGILNWVDGESLISYRVDFENDNTATAPAQIVTITDQLQAGLDRSTFELTEIGWGDVSIAVPPNTEHHEGVEPFSYNGLDFEVWYEVGIHHETGEVYASFYSIDPTTGLPPTIDYGFLPPEDGTGRGQGHFTYVMKPLPGLTPSTEIRNVANITFDFGETIATNQIDPHDFSQGTDPNKEALVTIAPPFSVLTISAGEGGSVPTPGEGQFQFEWGETVQIRAVGDGSDSWFVGWSGDIDTVADPSSPDTAITMYHDFAISANFLVAEPMPVTWQLQPGFNLVAMPNDPREPDLANRMDEIGTALEIERVQALDTETGRFSELLPGASDNPAFLLEGGEGLVVYASDTVDVTRTSLGCPDWNLVAGVNLVGSLCMPARTTAFNLLEAIGGELVVSAVERFNIETGKFESASYSDGVPAGMDFLLKNGEGYFIHMKQDLGPFGLW